MSTGRALELWGGVECTLARLGEGFRDQLQETGHRDREDDLDRIAALGIRTLRYPVLWEAISPDAPDRADWVWHDRRLTRLRDLRIRPIAGLLHHGSGPTYTHLLDPDFPRLFAGHAARVAARYPWIVDFTPINEPLTTARFSCLYGHWYPHRRSFADFLHATVNQCRATLLAMRAIRRITPEARLVQTDDLGRIFSTPALAYQAEHENERRWLAFDLLFGRVDRHHPWWRTCLDHGVPARHLAAFLPGEGRPDIVGINHYLTSDRFLDQRQEPYPPHLAGGNGRDDYADVEAVRVRLPRGLLGPGARLREAWERYRTPLALTEVHHGCTRDEQLRWLAECWSAAKTARRAGVDVRAVTAWSLFGARDWNSLLTRDEGIYEPGAFDARSTPTPRPTALAAGAQMLATTRRIAHPVLGSRGWWHRTDRFYVRPEPSRAARAGARPILILGPDGPIRDALSAAARARGLAIAHGPHGTGGLAWSIIEIGTRRSLPEMGSSVARLVVCAAPKIARTPRRHRKSASRLAPSPDGLGTIAVIGAPFGASAEPGPRDSHDDSTPWTYLPDFAHVALDLLIDRATGTHHLTSRPDGELTDPRAGRVGCDNPMPPLRSAIQRWRRDFPLSPETPLLAAE